MNHRLAELCKLCADAENRRTETGIPRVATVQGRVPEHELATVYEPMINLVLRGSKTLTVGTQTLRYDPATYFVMMIDLPALGTVQPAENGEPYLSVALTLDPDIVEAIVVDAGQQVGLGASCGFSTAPVSPELLDAWVRMLRLRERPQDIPVLAPAYEREIIYRVLQGPQGWLLRSVAMPDTAVTNVRRSIQQIRARFAEPLVVADLANAASLSPSAFHRHFKVVTTMSPVQFQKRIRLLRARSLLIGSGGTVASVAFSVGYESTSQFTREYARFFGAPPASDRSRLRHEFGRGRQPTVQARDGGAIA